MPTEAELRRLLAASCRILFRLGLVDYMGHPSVRIPGTEHVLIKPQHSRRIRSQDRLSPEDMVVIDLDGNPVEGRDRPPGERFIHTCIYRARPDIQAVVHTHQPMATVMGIGSAPIHPVLHVGSELLERPVPVWPCAKLVTDRGLGEQLAKALGDHALVLLQGHGITSVAGTVQQATINAIHLEQQAEANWRVLAMGQRPRVIPPDEIQQRAASGVGWEVRWAYYLERAEVDHAQAPSHPGLRRPRREAPGAPDPRGQ
jgi:ribulose-5-phosphate 4-epimerase/fuculose-1-phosphate aldolase